MLAKAQKQTPGQVRAATRRAVLAADLAVVQKRAEQARRERGIRTWPEPTGWPPYPPPTLSGCTPYSTTAPPIRPYRCQRSRDAQRGDALVDLVLGPTDYRSQATRTAARDHTITEPDGGHSGAGVAVRIPIPYTALFDATTRPNRPAGPAGNVSPSTGKRGWLRVTHQRPRGSRSGVSCHGCLGPE